MDTWKLKILHISDLQEGHSQAGSWRERRALGPAWARNLEAVLEEGPIDLVCFTGDAVSHGDTSEFSRASGFFEELLTKLSLARERLFLVPGNHDVDRSKAVSSWQALRHASTQVNSREFSQWLAGASPPPGMDEGLREQVLSRLGASRTWLGELGRKGLSQNKCNESDNEPTRQAPMGLSAAKEPSRGALYSSKNGHRSLAHQGQSGIRISAADFKQLTLRRKSSHGESNDSPFPSRQASARLAQ